MTWLVQTRKQWEDRTALNSKVGLPIMAEEEVVRRNAEWLLERLYMPDLEVGCVADDNILAALGLSLESINWGDLGIKVEKKGDHWHIVLEEAAPDSTALCRYVKAWLRKWGWDCHVEAQW